MIPVRCFTCGKVLGNLENSFCDLIKNSNDEHSVKKALNKLNLKRYCCRAIMMTYSK